jgi:hypothetical protein
MSKHDALTPSHAPWYISLAAGLGALLRATVRHVAALPPAERWRSPIEAAGLLLLFWAPHCADSNFHIHHYFYSWTVACLVNFDAGWARTVQAAFIGMYINGIAVCT